MITGQASLCHECLPLKWPILHLDLGLSLRKPGPLHIGPLWLKSSDPSIYHIGLVSSWVEAVGRFSVRPPGTHKIMATQTRTTR